MTSLPDVNVLLALVAGAHPNHSVAREWFRPPGREPIWSSIMKRPDIGPSSWTDAYLAAFAMQSGLEMVTFDRGFRADGAG
jgi:predicted nucleic acid-binding protein